MTCCVFEAFLADEKIFGYNIDMPDVLMERIAEMAKHALNKTLRSAEQDSAMLAVNHSMINQVFESF